MTIAEDALERAIADACLDVSAGTFMASDLRGFFEARHVPAEDIDAILSAPRTLGVYRRLVRNAISSVVLRVLPRTRTRMNQACDRRFDIDLARFLEEVSPRTHYLRDVPAELVAWVEPRWRTDPGVPRYLAELAVYELACFTIAAADVEPPNIAADLDPSKGLVFASAMRLASCEWAVHTLSDDPDERNLPNARHVDLLGYRDNEHTVRWLELTPLTAALVRRLIAGDALAMALTEACAERSATADPAEIAKLLTDLATRGILLGSKAIL